MPLASGLGSDVVFVILQAIRCHVLNDTNFDSLAVVMMTRGLAGSPLLVNETVDGYGYVLRSSKRKVAFLVLGKMFSKTCRVTSESPRLRELCWARLELWGETWGEKFRLCLQILSEDCGRVIVLGVRRQLWGLPSCCWVPSSSRDGDTCCICLKRWTLTQEKESRELSPKAGHLQGCPRSKIRQFTPDSRVATLKDSAFVATIPPPKASERSRAT